MRFRPWLSWNCHKFGSRFESKEFCLIRQIAALPYRTLGDGRDAGVSVLLITSRETRRWVIPKGNRMRSVGPHTAAAIEAEEEAGVLGAIGSTPIGSYRYSKRLRGGVSRMLDVDVFPLEVEQELERWKEAGERERRWFSLAEAADAVEEPDLAALIRAFTAEVSGEVSRHHAGRPSGGARAGTVLGWLRRWLPQGRSRRG